MARRRRLECARAQLELADLARCAHSVCDPEKPGTWAVRLLAFVRHTSIIVHLWLWQAVARCLVLRRSGAAAFRRRGLGRGCVSAV